MTQDIEQNYDELNNSYLITKKVNKLNLEFRSKNNLFDLIKRKFEKII